jgi:hypothetical protein
MRKFHPTQNYCFSTSQNLGACKPANEGFEAVFGKGKLMRMKKAIVQATDNF